MVGQVTDTVSAGARLRALGRRSLFGSLGGTILVLLGMMGLRGWGGSLPFVVPAVIGALFVLGAATLLSRASKDPAAASQYSAVRGHYLLVTRLEYLGFAATVVVFGYVLSQVQFIVPICAIISGLHFLALGQLLRMRSAYIRGILLCVLAAATMLVLPAQATVGAPVSGSVMVWPIVDGIASALVLWSDAALALVQGFGTKTR